LPRFEAGSPKGHTSALSTNPWALAICWFN
jgi:hypothetical protein